MADVMSGYVINIPNEPLDGDFINAVKELEKAAREGADCFSQIDIDGSPHLSVALSSNEMDIVLNFPREPLTQEQLEDMADKVQTLWEGSDSEIVAHSPSGSGPSDRVDNNGGEKARPDFGPYTERLVISPSQNENFHFRDALEAGKTPPFLKGEQVIEGSADVNADLAARTPGIFQRHGFDQLQGDMFSMTAAKNGLTAENSLVSIESGVQDKDAVDEMKGKFDESTLRIDRLSGMEDYVPSLKDAGGRAVTDKGGRPIQGVSLYIISACERGSGERVYERAYVSPDGTVLGTDDPNKSIFRIFPGDRLEIADRSGALVGKGRPFDDRDGLEKAIGTSVGEYTEKLRHEVGSKVEAAYKEKGGMEALRDRLSGFLSMAKTVRVLEMSEKAEIYGEKVSLVDIYKKLDASYDQGEAFSNKVRAGDKSQLSVEDMGLLKDIFTYINLSARPVIYNGKVRDGSEVLDRMTGDIKENISHEEFFSKIDLVSHKIDDLCRVDAETRVELGPAEAAYRTIIDSFGEGLLSEEEVIKQAAGYIKERVDAYNADKDEEHKLHVVTDDGGFVRVYTYGGDLVQPDRPSADFYNEEEDLRADKSEGTHDHRIGLLNDAYDKFFQGAPDISLYARSVIGRVIPYPSVIDGIFRVKTGDMRADFLTSDQKEELRDRIRDYVKDQYGIQADDKVVDEIMQTGNHPVVKEYMDALEDKPEDIERLEGLSYEGLNIISASQDDDKDKVSVDLDLPAESGGKAVMAERVLDLPKSHGRYGRVNYARDVALSDRCLYDLKTEATDKVTRVSQEFISAKEELQEDKAAIRREAVSSIADDYKEKAAEVYKADQSRYDGEAAVRTETYYVRHQDSLDKDFEEKAKAAGGDAQSYKEAWKKAAFESFKEDRIKSIATDLARDDDKALREEARDLVRTNGDYLEAAKTPELENEARDEARQWVQDNRDELIKDIRQEFSGKDTTGDPFDVRAKQELPDADDDTVKDRADQLRIQDGLDRKEDAKFKEIYDDKVKEKATDKAASDLYSKKIDDRAEQITNKKAMEKAVDKRLDSLTKEKKAELNRYKQAIMAVDKRLERYEGWPFRALIKNGNYNYNVYAKTVLIKGYLEAGGRDDDKFFKDHKGDPGVDPKSRSFLERGVSRFETAAAWKSAFIESRFFDTAFSEAMFNYSEKHPYEYKLEHGSELGFERFNSYRESRDFKKAFSYSSALNTLKLFGADALCITIGFAITGNPMVGVVAATLMSRGLVTVGRLVSMKNIESRIQDFIKTHRVDEISGTPISNDDKADGPDNDKTDKGDGDGVAAEGPDDSVLKEDGGPEAVTEKDQAAEEDSGEKVLQEDAEDGRPVTEEDQGQDAAAAEDLDDGDPLTGEEAREEAEEGKAAADEEERSEDPVAVEEEAEAKAEDGKAADDGGDDTSAPEKDGPDKPEGGSPDKPEKDSTDKPEKDGPDKPAKDGPDRPEGGGADAPEKDDTDNGKDRVESGARDPVEDGPAIREDEREGAVDLTGDIAQDQAEASAAGPDQQEDVTSQEDGQVDTPEEAKPPQGGEEGPSPVSSDEDGEDEVTVPESEGSGDNVAKEGAAHKEDRADRDDGEDGDAVAVPAGSGEEEEAPDAPEGKEPETAKAQEPQPPDGVDAAEEQAAGTAQVDEGAHAKEEQEKPAADKAHEEQPPITNDDSLGENIMDRLQMALSGKEEMDHVINGSGSFEGLSAAAEDASFDIAAFAKEAGEMVGTAAASPDTFDNAVSAAAYLDDFLSRFDTQENSLSDDFRDAARASLSEDPAASSVFDENVQGALEGLTERLADVGSIAGVEFEVDGDAGSLKDITADSISHAVTKEDDIDTDNPLDLVMDFARTALDALQDLGQSFGEILSDCLDSMLFTDYLEDPVTMEQLEHQEQGLDRGMDENERFETSLQYDDQEQLMQSTGMTEDEMKINANDEMTRLQEEIDADSMAEAIIASL